MFSPFHVTLDGGKNCCLRFAFAKGKVFFVASGSLHVRVPSHLIPDYVVFVGTSPGFDHQN